MAFIFPSRQSGVRHQSYLSSRGVPGFVFHGRRGRSRPFEKAERLLAGLRAAGTRVTFVVEDVAHERPPGAAITA